MIQMNVNAMTNQEIIAQYRTLEQQVATISKNGYIVGEEFQIRMEILKRAMDEKGLT